MRLYRLGKRVHAATVLSGAGGLVVDGRWHRAGQPIVYAATSEALAVLEVRVHLGRVRPAAAFTMTVLEIPDARIVRTDPDSLPADWNAVPMRPAAQHVGSEWLRGARSLALLVPSVHSATDHTVLVNPAHAAIGEAAVIEQRPYAFDGRLF